MTSIHFKGSFQGLSYQKDLYLPDEFDIVFEENNVKLKYGMSEISLETRIHPKQEIIYLFTEIQKDIVRIKIDQSSSLYGEVRIRVNNSNYYLIYNLNSDDNIQDHHFNINNINKMKEYWKELPYKFLYNYENIEELFNDLHIEKYLNIFLEEEVDLHSLILYDEERLIKYIPKEGPRLILLDWITTNSKKLKLD